MLGLRLSTTLSLIAASLSSATSRWSPKQFIISAWVDPVVPEADFPAEYAIYAAAGFNLLLGGFGATTPTAVAASVAAAAVAGLSAAPSACETPAGPAPGGSCVNQWGSSPALVGFQMLDEPSASEFPAVAAWAASVAARAPGALRFINLLPNYASAGALGTATYGEYLERYVATVAPDMLCFDSYPVFGPGSASSTTDNATMAGYIRNLADVRATALAAGLPFMNFFSTMPFNNRSDVSESQLWWQAWTSLAHGASGVLYFCYWSPVSADFKWANAIITPIAPAAGGAAVFVRGQHYAQAARLNARLGVLGNFLLNSTSVAVFAANGTGASMAAAPPAVLPLLQYGGSGAGPTWSLLIGAFRLPAARAPHTLALLITNQDTELPVLAALALAAGGAATAAELDAASGIVHPALDDAPGLPGLQWSIASGDARLFLL